MVSRMQRFLTAYFAGIIVFSMGCGSALEDPISNADGCRRINEALSKVCTDSESLQWLNCDVLPGCPSGTVEGQHIEACAVKIEAAPSCSAAKQIDCEISKLDCGSAAPSFTEAMGMGAACTLLLDALGGTCDDTEVSDCDAFVSCPGGAVETGDIQTCVSGIQEATTCATAKATNCVISSKYCAP